MSWPHHAILSLFYVIAMFWVAIALIFYLHRRPLLVGPGYIALLIFCNHIGLLCGYSLANGTEYMLWPADAIDHHLPNAIAFSEWISGVGEIEFFSDNPFKKIYVSNMWVGLFFLVFGVYPIVSAFAMLIIKLITIILIFKSALNFTKDQSIALTASIIYGLLPTITFYTIQFYKDFFIHFLVALTLFIFFRAIEKPKMLILIAIPLVILFVERFYLLVMICVALTFYYWSLTGKKFMKLVILALAGLTSFIVLNHYFEGRGVQELIETIQSFESTQNDSTDVTPTTNIALDFFRIAFTPFFNMYKLNQYSAFDSILIFGGFIHQLIMLFYLRGLWIERKNRVVFINFAFFFLLVILALIMPYDGRARDSFYPLVSIFAAIGIASLLKSKKLKLAL